MCVCYTRTSPGPSGMPYPNCRVERGSADHNPCTRSRREASGPRGGRVAVLYFVEEQEKATVPQTEGEAVGRGPGTCVFVYMFAALSAGQARAPAAQICAPGGHAACGQGARASGEADDDDEHCIVGRMFACNGCHCNMSYQEQDVIEVFETHKTQWCSVQW